MYIVFIFDELFMSLNRYFTPSVIYKIGCRMDVIKLINLKFMPSFQGDVTPIVHLNVLDQAVSSVRITC
jgi:hypothetical protein